MRPQDSKVIMELRNLVRNYNGLVKLITSAKNRCRSVNPDMDPKHDPFIGGEDGNKGLESLKAQLARRMGKAIEQWPIWTLWLKEIRGIGSTIGAELILLYYYKFIPVCQKCNSDLEHRESEMDFYCPSCEKPARGDGNLSHRIAERDFPNISCWWSFLGRNPVDGKVPKRKKGVKMNWSNKGRQVGWQIGEQFVRQNTPHYREFFDRTKKNKAAKRKEWTLGHMNKAAKWETANLFLAHFWVVARTIEGLPLTEPYAGTIMGHTGIIAPYFWDSRVLLEEAA